MLPPPPPSVARVVRYLSVMSFYAEQTRTSTMPLQTCSRGLCAQRPTVRAVKRWSQMRTHQVDLALQTDKLLHPSSPREPVSSAAARSTHDAQDNPPELESDGDELPQTCYRPGGLTADMSSPTGCVRQRYAF